MLSLKILFVLDLLKVYISFLAGSYFELGDYESAIINCEKTLDDSSPYIWNNYRLALENAGRTEDAKYAYRKALEIDPDNDISKERL